MVQTWNSENNNSPDLIATQLAAIAAKLEAIKTMKEDIAALKEGSRSSGSKNFKGEVLGWVENSIGPIKKAEIASMHLEEDALDLYSWLSDGQVIFWKELVQVFTINFGPTEFQNPDEFFCSIKQTGCGDKYEPGHLCKTGTLKVLEANEDVEEPLITYLTILESDPKETAEISLHAILEKPHPTTMKDVIQCGEICKNLPVHIIDPKITQEFHAFRLEDKAFYREGKEVEVEEEEEEEEEEDDGEEEPEPEEEEEGDEEEEEEEDDEASKKEFLRKLLEPLPKEKIIEFLTEAALNDPSIMAALTQTAEMDPVHRRIFVFGLGRDATTDQVLSAFEQYGDIEQCRVV
nr:UBP1-associated protein 2A-like [Tanacetum cinerariifolium]